MRRFKKQSLNRKDYRLEEVTASICRVLLTQSWYSMRFIFGPGTQLAISSTKIEPTTALSYRNIFNAYNERS